MVTAKQRAVLDYIQSHTSSHGYQPTYREIAEHLGVVVSTVHRHLAALEKKGIVRRRGNRNRAVEIMRGGGEVGTIQRPFSKL